MKTLITTAILILSIIAFTSTSFSASNNCSVVEVDENKLVLECERDNDQLQPGDKVKIKSVRKGSAVEGC